MEWFDIIKAVWKKAKYWAMITIAGALSTAYYFSKDVIDDYRARQHAIEFKADLILAFEDEDVIDTLFSKENFITLFFESPHVKQKINELGETLGTEVRNAIIDDVSKQDTMKVSTRAEMSKRLRIRDEDYFPLLEKALRAVLKEENASKKDVKAQIKKNVKQSALKPPSF